MRTMPGLLIVLLLSCMSAVSAQTSSKDKAEGIDIGKYVKPEGLESGYVHGTIDLVISTREGFVLATDSRLTNDLTGGHTDDGQKLFPVGKNGAAVIAGVIGSQIGIQGFGLRDAIATNLQSANDHFRDQYLSASRIGDIFSFGLGSVAGLMIPGNPRQSPPVAAISAVSFDANGHPEWLTLTLPLKETQYNGQPFFTTGDPIKNNRQLEQGTHFDYQTIGYPYTVEILLKADRPLSDALAQIDILKRYYQLKAEGRLDEFTLSDATELAKVLIETTFKYAPAEAGVGGPIDIATLTPHGFTWVSRKSRYAPVPPPFRVRFIGTQFGDEHQTLDGLECVRCTFENMDLSFEGKARPQLLGCTFKGSCKLTILPGARSRMPDAVSYLKSKMPPNCVVTDQDDPKPQ